MADGSPGMVVKNTFIELGEEAEVVRRGSKVLRRQSSEPILGYSSGSAASGSEKAEPAGPPAPAQATGTPTTLQESDSVSEVLSSDDEHFWGQRSVDHRGCAFGAIGDADATAAPFMSRSLPASPVAQRSGYTVGAVPQRGFVLSPLSTGPSWHIVPFQQDGYPGPREAPRFRRAGDPREVRDKKDLRVRDAQMSKIKDTSITNKEPPWTDVTTVMMRNLPNKYFQSRLIEELGESGFHVRHHFNFFYLPMDHTSAANLGYCFINFLDTEIANAFAATFSGRRMRRFNSSKTVVVMPASVQGYDRNFAYYSSTRVAQADDPQYRPLFVKPSDCVRQPPPEQKLQLPTGKAGRRGARAAKSGGEASPAGASAASPARCSPSRFSAAAEAWSPQGAGGRAPEQRSWGEWPCEGQSAPGSPMNPGSPYGGAYFAGCEGMDGWVGFECASPSHGSMAGFGQACPPPR